MGRAGVTHALPTTPLPSKKCFVNACFLGEWWFVSVLLFAVVVCLLYVLVDACHSVDVPVRVPVGSVCHYHLQHHI